MNHCINCTLNNSYKSLGFGIPINPKFMIIGDMPGKDQDSPYGNGTSSILYSLLHSAGIDKRDCYFTSIVKCNTPNNRMPEINEIYNCQNYIWKDITKINPEKIICIGKIASSIIVGRDLSSRGLITKPILGDIPTLITIHPRDLMKQRELWPVVIWDLIRLRDWKGEEIGEKDYLINPPIEVFIQLMDRWEDTPIAVDIETTGDKSEKGGLNPFKDNIIGIAFCGEPGIAIQYNGKYLKENWGMISKFLEKHKMQVYQNNLFDRTFLWCKGIKVPKIWWDTQTGMNIINSSLPKKLDFLRSLYTNFEPYKSKDNYKYQLEWLNCRDVDVTLRVYKEQKKVVKPEMNERLMLIEEVALHMRLRGVKIDKNAIGGHYYYYKPMADKLFEEFQREYGIEISSPKQLAKFLYKDLNIPIPPSALKKGRESTDEEALTEIKYSFLGDSKEKLIFDRILDYREHAKIASIYCEGLFKLINEQDGRIHPDWKTTGTDTGRWACKEPNLQNFQKHMRNVAIPETGKCYFGCDYDRLEIWVAALLSEEYELIDMLEKGIDIHEQVRASIEPYYPQITRLQAKTVVFGTFYGRGAKTIAHMYRVPVKIAQQWQDSFFNRFEKLKYFFTVKIPNEFNRKGYIETIFGRRKYCDTLPKAMNMPIQSTASEIVANAMIKLHEAKFNLVINVHDQLIAEEEYNINRFNEFQRIMETSTPQLHNRFPAAGGIYKNWMEEEYETE